MFFIFQKLTFGPNFDTTQLAYGAGGVGRPYSSLAMRDYELGGGAASGGALAGLDGLHTDNSRSYLGGAGSRLSGASDPTGMATGGGLSLIHI